MFESTKLHEEITDSKSRKYTLRVGSRVPENAVNLAYYFNKKATVEENVLVADAPVITTDHISTEKRLTKLKQFAIDDDLFPLSIPYVDDNGYTGRLDRSVVEWITNKYQDDKSIVYNPNPVIVSSQESPSTIFYQEGDYSGTIQLMNVTYEPYGTRTDLVDTVVSKEGIRTLHKDKLPDDSYNWPEQYTFVDNDGYSGRLQRVGNPIYLKDQTATGGLELTQYKKEKWFQDVPTSYSTYVDGVKVDFEIVGSVQEVPGSTMTRYKYGPDADSITEFPEIIDNRPVTFKRIRVGNKVTSVITRTKYGGDTVKESFTETIDGKVVTFTRGPVEETGGDVEHSFKYGNEALTIKEFDEPVNDGVVHFTFEKMVTYEGPVLTVTKTGTEAEKTTWTDPATSYVYSRVGEPTGGNTTKTYIGYSRWLGNSSYGYGGGHSWNDSVPQTFEWAYDSNMNPLFQWNNSSTHTYNGQTWRFVKVEWAGPKQYSATPLYDAFVPSAANYYYRDVKITYEITTPGTKSATFQYQNKGPVTAQYKGIYKGKKAVYTATATTREGVYTASIMGGRGTYKGHRSDGTQDYWGGDQNYQGILYKTEKKPTDIITSWKATRIYEGIISKITYDYDGTAYYSGTATKRSTVNNLPIQSNNEYIMYPDSSGVLLNDLNERELESELFYVTNMFKDNVPLYYCYRLKYPIFDYQGPDDFGIYQGNSIKLVDSLLKPLNKDKYKYQIKLQPYDPEDPNYDNIYNVFIYTSFITTSSVTVKVVYNAYENDLSDVKSGIVENLNVQPFYELNKDYKVIPVDERLRRNYLQLVNNLIIPDARRKVHFHYIVKTTDEVYISQPISADAINKDFALSVELDQFNGRNYIISPVKNGRYLTAFDIIVDHYKLSEAEQEVLKTKSFDVDLYLSDAITSENRYKLNIYTPSNGDDVVSVETTELTGFFNPLNGKYDKIIALPGKYKLLNSMIYPAYSVKCRDLREVRTLSPRETNLLESWYARIQFSHFNKITELNGIHTRYTYTIPEYNEQNYSSIYGRPYIDVIEEQVKIVGDHTVKVKLAPMYVKVDNLFNPVNLRIQKISGDTVSILTIISWNFTEGFIDVEEVLSENDIVLVDYTYEEQSYIYRGFYDTSNNFVDIEFNVNQYHTYLDNTQPLSNPERKPVYNLLNSIVTFFLKPSVIQSLDLNGDPIAESEILNTQTIYHKINDQEPNNDEDLIIGNVYVRHNTSLEATQIIDSRTRGGGLIEELDDRLRHELEPESDYYWDIGYWDGEPYTENAVIIIRLDRRILKEYGGQFTLQEVEKAVHKWIAAGVVPIIEYIQTFAQDELPQTSLTVTGEYLNKLDFKPEATISIETIS